MTWFIKFVLCLLSRRGRQMVFEWWVTYSFAGNQVKIGPYETLVAATFHRRDISQFEWITDAQIVPLPKAEPAQE